MQGFVPPARIVDMLYSTIQKDSKFVWVRPGSWIHQGNMAMRCVLCTLLVIRQQTSSQAYTPPPSCSYWLVSRCTTYWGTRVQLSNASIFVCSSLLYDVLYQSCTLQVNSLFICLLNLCIQITGPFSVWAFYKVPSLHSHSTHTSSISKEN